jgi:alpha-L-fucosidase
MKRNVYSRRIRPTRLAGIAIIAAVLAAPLSPTFGDQTNVTADLSKSLGEISRTDHCEYTRRTDAAMAHWRADRFGIMIHWGVYAIPGGWWNGKEVRGAAEWIKVFAKIPKAEYDALLPQFNPTNYNPQAWAKQFKATGAKYVVITTKHHDGFCLWDSKFTDYDIGGTPYKKDLLQPLADALRAEGIDVGFYYSIIDWHHPDYRASVKTDDDKAAYARYIQYMKDQIKELLTKFGPITTLWFDGRWDPAYKTNPQIGKDLEAYCRSLSPGLVLGDRVRAYDSVADYDFGFERRLPAKQPATDWECCMTMTENAWGYHATWSGNGWKTPRYLCELLTRCSAMNGNFLVNIGPRSDGTIRPEETQRLERMARWMAVNSEAIYGTEAGPALELPDGIYTTRKGSRIFVHVYRWPDTDKLKLKGLAIASATMLTANSPKPVNLENGDTLTGLPQTPPDNIATVFALDLK